MKKPRFKRRFQLIFIVMTFAFVWMAVGQNTVWAKGKKVKITNKERDAYIGKSAFIGSSIGVGQQMYFRSQGSSFLGNPIMLVKGSYSFRGEKHLPNYRLSYRGFSGPAAQVVKATKAKRLFINMGTNDLWQPAVKTYEDYVDYLKKIRTANPKLVIFVESTTPMYKGRDQSNLNNKNINKLNRLMKKYCKSQKDMYFIDVSSAMKGVDGTLKPAYSGDRFVHLSMKGYEVWTKKLCDYVKNLLLQEKKAKLAVTKASKSKTQEDYDEAKRLVKSLEKSTVKDELLKKLKRIEKKIKSGQETLPASYLF